jgi:cell division cycle 20, cofactor of APC complex
MNNHHHHHHHMTQTPPRRYMRGSKLMPSSVPTITTPCRNSTTSRGNNNTPYGNTSRAMHTAPRSLYSSFNNNNNANTNSNIAGGNNNAAYNSMSSSPMRTPHRQHQITPGHCYTPGTITPSKLDDDRFIPSRRRLNIDLCRRALTSSSPGGGGGDKRSRYEHQQSLQDPSVAAMPSSSSSTTPSPSRPVVSDETPLQKEFKRRMLSSLCNIPLDRLDEDGEPMSLLSFGGGGASSSSSNENGNGSGGGWNGSSRRGINNNYPLGSSGELSSNSNNTSSNLMMNSPAMMVNPFEHDTLRQMKLGDSDFDPAARLSVAKKVLRKVPSAPIRILDAPDIVDDYYLNLISWSKDNILAVALAQAVYLWNAATGEIQHLLTVDQGTDYITSVCWSPVPGQTKYLAVGTNTAQVHLFDGHALRKIRTLTGHTARVSSLAWNEHWMTSGARDSLIINHDIRQANAIVNTYKGHEQEVCGLKWNEDGSTLASGGNENFLCLWDAAMSNTSSSSSSSYGSHFGSASRNNSTIAGDHAPRLILKQHKAAVKALDWCPFHRGLLASGGGTADRTIKFWNSSSGAMLNSIDTGSQVCSIVWSKHQRELCSSHGYSENQLILWKYPSMTKIKELTGHTARVLNMEMSPDGGSVVSAAADETLRFWNIFGSPNSLHNRNPGSALVGDYPSFGVPAIR